MSVKAMRPALLISGLVLVIGSAPAGPGPAMAQSQYHEAPMLAAMVEAGDLPPGAPA
jgi:hypothetical protein